MERALKTGRRGLRGKRGRTYIRPRSVRKVRKSSKRTRRKVSKRLPKSIVIKPIEIHGPSKANVLKALDQYKYHSKRGDKMKAVTYFITAVAAASSLLPVHSHAAQRPLIRPQDDYTSGLLSDAQGLIDWQTHAIHGIQGNKYKSIRPRRSSKYHPGKKKRGRTRRKRKRGGKKKVVSFL